MSAAPTPESDAAAPAVQPVPRTGSAVRRNALWAAGAAVIMLWYGFRAFELDKSVATVGEFIFFYTLRVGGVLMAVSALFSLSGLRPALIFDGVASILIGLAFLASAGLMYSDHATQSLLNVLFGLVFLHSGYRNWEEHRALGTAGAAPLATSESHVPPA